MAYCCILNTVAYLHTEYSLHTRCILYAVWRGLTQCLSDEYLVCSKQGMQRGMQHARSSHTGSHFPHTMTPETGVQTGDIVNRAPQ